MAKNKNLYHFKSRWKIYLSIVGAIIILISAYFTYYLTSRLAAEERKRMELYVQAQEMVNDLNYEGDLFLHLNIIRSNTTIPVILVNDRGTIIDARNFGARRDTSQVFREKALQRIKRFGPEPIKGFAYYIYYQNSTLLRLLQIFPVIQFLLIAAFITYGYFSFSAARRAEQNQVWVGLAKETAHQLGTPISAIVAWLEHLKLMDDADPFAKEIYQELEKDVARLEIIADRFSKIGSAPKLEAISAHEEITKCFHYMEKRSPRKVSFDYPKPPEQLSPININPPLFDWVIENLIRNALDAMEGKGEISGKISQDKQFVCIDITDTGKGIPTSKVKTVFKPGYTTKQRGWGLGLSLAKRIIETYHSGKIFVKRSMLNQGTTFTIKLPKAESTN